MRGFNALGRGHPSPSSMLSLHVKVACASKMLASISRTTRCHIPGDSTISLSIFATHMLKN